jgi:lipopolysaccharide assembly protein A
MRVIRTLIWIVITAVLVAFIAMNWQKSAVNIWPLAEGYLHLEWPIGLIALVFFLIGFLPTWLLHKASKWRMTRRIATLEASLRASTAPPALPVATTTQLEQARADEPPKDEAHRSAAFPDGLPG